MKPPNFKIWFIPISILINMFFLTIFDYLSVGFDSFTFDLFKVNVEVSLLGTIFSYLILLMIKRLK